MATIKEQIAQHTPAETTQQQLPDDPLAPKPIRFTHQRGADGVLHKRTVNGPTAGWHLEDGAEDEDAEPPPQGRGQTRDYQQQARVNQAYPPDYEDADEPDTRPPRSAMRYQHTLPHQYRGQTVLPTPPQQLRRQRLTGQAPGQRPRPPRRRNKHWSSACTAWAAGGNTCRTIGPMACLGRTRPMPWWDTTMTQPAIQVIS